MADISYKMTGAFDIAQRKRAAELLAQGAREQWGTNRMQTMLQREGLGYTRSAIVEDYRHAEVVSTSKSDEALGRAESFYQRVYEPFRKEMNLTAPQMGSIMSGFKGEAEIPEDLLDAVEQWDAWTESEGT